jgi:alkylation response protein AidB-like acyl-CoA dehydrogenase
MNFVLHEVIGVERWRELAVFKDFTPDIQQALLEAAATLTQESIAPLNAVGDEQGCRLNGSQVTTPSGFAQAYAAFVEGGWPGLAHDTQWGGQGLPYLFSQILMEMLAGANSAFSLFPMLTHSACAGITAHASEELKRSYLPKLVSGQWTGTMLLTEPQAGSDLNLVRTQAEPAPDGSYRLSGTKIFITGGEHDLAENIIHIVLARLPNAPAGMRGLSMFLVPRHLPDGQGNPGRRNSVRCIRLERKMGIHGSPTCVMQFDEAVGYLVGEPHQGIRNMFTLMNLARLAVGNQGLGIAEAAMQNAYRYAAERRQGNQRKGDLQTGPVPIIQHPDVRRMLATMRALTEGGRVLAYETALQVDVAAHHPDPQVRATAADQVEFMTPICKAFLTDMGFEVASLAVQVYGGHGYIRDNGMEQYLRDARINCLYEGTNGIQAMDLVGRKLSLLNGRMPEHLFVQIDDFLQRHHDNNGLAFIIAPMQAALQTSREISDLLRTQGTDWAGAVAYDYLRMMSLLAVGDAWCRMAAVALPRIDDAFYASKLALAQFFAARLLPQLQALACGIRAGDVGLDNDTVFLGEA